MKDVLGQEVTVGSKVLWGGGKTQYAGFAGGPVEVVKLTPQKVRIRVPVHWAKDRFDEKTVYPSDLVVVDRLLAAPETSNGLPHDLFTHQLAWRNALSKLAQQGGADDRSYWRHELAAFDRTYRVLSPLAEGFAE